MLGKQFGYLGVDGVEHVGGFLHQQIRLMGDRSWLESQAMNQVGGCWDTAGRDGGHGVSFRAL